MAGQWDKSDGTTKDIIHRQDPIKCGPGSKITCDPGINDLQIVWVLPNVVEQQRKIAFDPCRCLVALPLVEALAAVCLADGDAMERSEEGAVERQTIAGLWAITTTQLEIQEWALPEMTPCEVDSL